MRCLFPMTVGFRADGKTISWSQKTRSKEYAPFQLPCSKCIECRLEYARSWAIRCVHEAAMHEKNAFITLTYDEQNLASDRLQYRDFQLFMKKLRKTQNEPIGVFVTGEYGDNGKRPHWHACLFNWSPLDATYKYSNDRGDRVYQSKLLSRTWGMGLAEFGAVTFHSAGYCARYAAKKLVHGHDGTHDYEPISKKSSKHAIGKTWLEKFWPDVFSSGSIRLSDGSASAIPRYYEKWLQKNQPEAWFEYVTNKKIENQKNAALRAEKDQAQYNVMLSARRWDQPNPFTMNQIREVITKQKFEYLQSKLKL